jgi:cell division topological specificity factor
MRLFSFLRPISSAPVARERLQILLEYERNLVSQTDLIAVLREEILAVVRRHVTIDPDKVQISMDRGAKFSTMAVDIEIPNTRMAAALCARHRVRSRRARRSRSPFPAW